MATKRIPQLGGGGGISTRAGTGRFGMGAVVSGDGARPGGGNPVDGYGAPPSWETGGGNAGGGGIGANPLANTAALVEALPPLTGVSVADALAQGAKKTRKTGRAGSL